MNSQSKHDVVKIEVKDIHELPVVKSFTREIIITSPAGIKESITLFSNDNKALEIIFS